MTPTFFVTCLGGLEAVVAEELAERVPAVEILAREFGRVHFRYGGPVTDLLGLRTIEHLHAQVARLEGVGPGQAWLAELERALAALDLQPALALLAQVQPLPPAPSFRVTATRQGQHDFGSMDAAGFAGAGIVAGTGWRVDLENHDVEVRLEIRQDQALVGVRLSPAALHHRSRVVHMRASLNPTAAAALVRLSRPASGEVFLDPMCGAGTILTERHQHDPAVTLLGGDLFTEKLALTRENCAHFGVPVGLWQADAGALPLADHSVDKVVCNLPWGRVVANARINRRLYPRALAEMARVLRPGGWAVLLTSERHLTERVLSHLGTLKLRRQLHLHIGGLEPSIYVVERWSS